MPGESRGHRTSDGASRRSTAAWVEQLLRSHSLRRSRTDRTNRQGPTPRCGDLVGAHQGELARISGAGPRSAGLSETERRIAELAIVGRSNKQIAAELHLTVRAVESNLSRVYRKHGVSSRAQLAHLIRCERDRLTTPLAEA